MRFVVLINVKHVLKIQMHVLPVLVVLIEISILIVLARVDSLIKIIIKYVVPTYANNASHNLNNVCNAKQVLTEIIL